VGYPDDTTTCKEDDKVMTTGRSSLIIAVALLGLLFLPLQASAETAAAKAPEAAKTQVMSDCPCPCDKCPKEGKCGQMHGGHGMPPMMEGMKKHMEEVRKSVAGLRDHEKKLEGVTDPAEFRKAAIEHFRMLDDLQESHLKHMESMAGSKGHGHPCKEPCREPCPERSGK
jgi:hypothetical protein